MTSPTASSGTEIVSFTIGSSRQASASAAACLNAIEPATLNAFSDESTVWYWPS